MLQPLLKMFCKIELIVHRHLVVWGTCLEQDLNFVPLSGDELTHLLGEPMIDLIGKLVHLCLLAVGLAAWTCHLNAMAFQNGSFWL